MAKNKRPRFRAKEVTLLECEPGSFDDNGEAATVITLATKSHIEPVVINLADSRKLVVEMLVCLHSNDDEIAAKILADSFSVKDGQYCWPLAE